MKLWICLSGVDRNSSIDLPVSKLIELSSVRVAGRV